LISNVKLEWWLSFADGPNGGNPAPIVLNGDELNAAKMQSIAAELGFETVFVTSPSNGGECRLRFFVPRYEVDMCGHGTIAALTLLRSRGLISHAGSVETASGRRRFKSGRDGMMLRLGRLERSESTPSTDEVAAALGVAPCQIGGELGGIATVSVARSNIMIPLLDEPTLDCLRPRFEELWTLCRRHHSTGAYVCAPTRAAGIDVTARGFPLDVGYPEDPATGTAAGALAAELHSRGVAPEDQDGGIFRIRQGYGIRRPSLILARAPEAADPYTWIGGRAEAIARASIQPLA
jgi:trans-2,3-dihydro-3-hydroxyanthranilate isomerase